MSKSNQNPHSAAAQALAMLEQAWEYYTPGAPKTAPVNDYHPSTMAA